MILYIGNPKESKKIVRINKFSKVAGYKINMQKSVHFSTLVANYQKEIKKTISFTITSKGIKYLRINLTKKVKDLSSENCMTLMKKFHQYSEDTHNWKDIPCSWIKRINIVGASLVAQWLGVCLLMQGTRVRALVWEDPTCHGAAGPVSHNY